MTLKWENPEPRRTKGNKWETIANELRAHPGQWAVVAENVSASITVQIKSGVYGSMPRGEFEAVARGTHGNRAEKIYARYVGDGSWMVDEYDIDGVES